MFRTVRFTLALVAGLALVAWGEARGRRASAAGYYLRSQGEIDALLGILVRLRRDAGIARLPWGGR